MLIFAQITDSIPTLGAMNPVFTNLLIGLFLLISVLMILLVLIQRPQGGGLSGAFGAGGAGAGAGQSAFGTKTGDMLTYATIGIFICFLAAAIVLNFATRPAGPVSTETLLSAPAGSSSSVPTDETADESTGESTDEDASTPDATPQPVETPAEEANEIVDDATDAIETEAGTEPVPQSDDESKPNVNAGDD